MDKDLAVVLIIIALAAYPIWIALKRIKSTLIFALVFLLIVAVASSLVAGTDYLLVYYNVWEWQGYSGPINFHKNR